MNQETQPDSSGPMCCSAADGPQLPANADRSADEQFALAIRTIWAYRQRIILTTQIAKGIQDQWQYNKSMSILRTVNQCVRLLVQQAKANKIDTA